jgi:hypothetical protein
MKHLKIRNLIAIIPLSSGAMSAYAATPVCVAPGCNSVTSDGNGNTATGTGALSVTGGENNTAAGGALGQNTSGAGNTAAGGEHPSLQLERQQQHRYRVSRAFQLERWE